jgi:nitrate/nitrite-specific signal transduction histidine kinase
MIRESLMLGTVGPLLLWFSLTWLMRAIGARANAEETLALLNRELSAVNAVASTAGASLDLQTILDGALDQILDVTGVEVGEIFLLDDAQEAVVMAAHRGILIETFREIERFPLGEGFPGRVALTGEPMVTTELANDLRYLRRQVVEAGFGSYACVPVQAKGRVVGTLSVAAIGHRRLSSRDLQLLTAIGLQLGLAVENARLFEAERTQHELADTLRSVSRAVGASLDLDEVLKEILNQLGRVLIVDAGLILLAEGERLTVAATRGQPSTGLERLVGYTFDARVSPSLAKVLHGKRPLTFCDPVRTDIFSGGIDRIEDIQWCLVVPLIHSGEAIGLLTLEQVGHCYNQEEEAQIAFAFANHAAAAIANARLFDERRKVSTLEERYRLARDMHDGLVQTLSFLNMKIDATQSHLSGDDVPRARAGLARMRQVVGQAYEDLREMIVGLKEPHPHDHTLEHVLRDHLNRLRLGSDVDVNLIVSPTWTHGLSTPAIAEIARIVQEALTNVHRHAQARRAWVRLQKADGEARIVVEDDGRGFLSDPPEGREESKSHFGLTIMQERAEGIGGQLEITERSNGGTRVQVSVPLEMDT